MAEDVRLRLETAAGAPERIAADASRLGIDLLGYRSPEALREAYTERVAETAGGYPASTELGRSILKAVAKGIAEEKLVCDTLGSGEQSLRGLDYWSEVGRIESSMLEAVQTFRSDFARALLTDAKLLEDTLSFRPGVTLTNPPSEHMVRLVDATAALLMGRGLALPSEASLIALGRLAHNEGPAWLAELAAQDRDAGQAIRAAYLAVRPLLQTERSRASSLRRDLGSSSAALEAEAARYFEAKFKAHMSKFDMLFGIAPEGGAFVARIPVAALPREVLSALKYYAELIRDPSRSRTPVDWGEIELDVETAGGARIDAAASSLGSASPRKESAVGYAASTELGRAILEAVAKDVAEEKRDYEGQEHSGALGRAIARWEEVDQAVQSLSETARAFEGDLARALLTDAKLLRDTLSFRPGMTVTSPPSENVVRIVDATAEVLKGRGVALDSEKSVIALARVVHRQGPEWLAQLAAQDRAAAQTIKDAYLAVRPVLQEDRAYSRETLFPSDLWSSRSASSSGAARQHYAELNGQLARFDALFGLAPAEANVVARIPAYALPPEVLSALSNHLQSAYEPTRGFRRPSDWGDLEIVVRER